MKVKFRGACLTHTHLKLTNKSDLEQYLVVSLGHRELNPKYEPNFASQNETYFAKENISQYSYFRYYYSLLENMNCRLHFRGNSI